MYSCSYELQGMLILCDQQKGLPFNKSTRSSGVTLIHTYGQQTVTHVTMKATSHSEDCTTLQSYRDHKHCQLHKYNVCVKYMYVYK